MNEVRTATLREAARPEDLRYWVVTLCLRRAVDEEVIVPVLPLPSGVFVACPAVWVEVVA